MRCCKSCLPLKYENDIVSIKHDFINMTSSLPRKFSCCFTFVKVDDGITASLVPVYSRGWDFSMEIPKWLDGILWVDLDPQDGVRRDEFVIKIKT